MIQVVIAALFFWMMTVASFVFSFLVEPPPIVLHLMYGVLTRGPIGRKVHTLIMATVALGLSGYAVALFLRTQ